MTLLKRITRISALQNAMAIGIVCLTDTNVNGEIRFAYLTTNEHLIDFLGQDDCQLENEIEAVGEEVIVALNILEDDFIHLQPHIYNGYAHDIAQLTPPTTEVKSELLKLNANKFVDINGNPAELVNVFDQSQEFNLVFCILSDSDQKVAQVNEKGENRNGTGLIFNADEVALDERDGYLLISKKHNPVFVSKDEKDSVVLTGKSKLFAAIGYVDSKEHLQAVVLLANSLND